MLSTLHNKPPHSSVPWNSQLLLLFTILGLCPRAAAGQLCHHCPCLGFSPGLPASQAQASPSTFSRWPQRSKREAEAAKAFARCRVRQVCLRPVVLASPVATPRVRARGHRARGVREPEDPGPGGQSGHRRLVFRSVPLCDGHTVSPRMGHPSPFSRTPVISVLCCYQGRTV